MPIVLNGSGPVTGVTSLNTTVSDTEIGFLDGVTSAIQTQINGAGGLVKITDATFSAQSTVSVNNCFSTTYDAYRIVIRTTGSANADLGYRNRLSGTDATTNYNRQFLSGSGATPASGRVTGQVNAVLGSHRTTGQSEYWVDIYGPALAAETGIYSLNRDRDGDISLINYVALHTTATAYDGFTIFPGSGTMTGTLRVYGYRN